MSRAAEREIDERIELASRQCILVQEMTKASLLAVEAEVPDIAEHLLNPQRQRKQFISELRVALNEWQNNQQKLKSELEQATNDPLSQTAIRSIRESEPDFLKLQESYRFIADNNGVIKDHSTLDQLATILATEPEYRKTLNRFTNSAHHRYEHAERQLVWTLLMAWGGSLLVMIGAGVFIMRPTTLKLVQAYREIEEKSDHLEEQNAEILSMQAEIECQLVHIEESEERAHEAANRATANLKIAEYSASRFQELFQGLPVACFTIDREYLVHEWNRAASDLFEVEGHTAFLNPIFAVLPAFEESSAERSALDSALNGESAIGSETRFLTVSGAERWFIQYAFPLKDQKGKISSAICACVDITERKISEQNLLRAEERVRSIVEAASDAIVTTDSNGIVLSFNDAAVEMFGYEIDEVVGKNVSMLMPEPHRGRHDSYIQRASTAESIVGKVREVFALRNDGSEFPIELCISKGVAAGETFFTGIIRDISERKALEEQIEEQISMVSEMNIELELRQQALVSANEKLCALATTDGLTGLVNHRTMQEMLEEEFNNPDEPLSFLLIDIDHFKSFNDTFGHQAGDKVLRSVADMLACAIKDMGIVARYGGEEFAVVLPGIEEKDALRYAEDIRTCVMSAECEYRQITVSIGAAIKSAEHTQPALLISDSDKALYASKRAGRNCVTLYDEAIAA